MGKDFDLNLSLTILTNWITAHSKLNLVSSKRIWCHSSLIAIYFQKFLVWNVSVEE